MAVEIGIIGGGPAGLTAAIYAARAGYRPVIWEAASCGGQMLLTHEIENYPGVPNVSGMDLADSMTAQAQALGVEIRYGLIQSVTQTADGFVLDAEGTPEKCRALIVASGADHRKLGAPGEEKFTGRGVSYCAVCDGRFFAQKDVAVVGGGNTALGDALYLSRICRTVTLIHRRDAFRADRILVDRAQKTGNIRYCLSARVEEIVGDERVNGVRVADIADADKPTQTLPVSAVFIAVGNTPQTGFLASLSALTMESGYIPTDDCCASNVPGLFAAGDVRVKSLRQVATAVSDGAVAGVAAAEYIEHLN